MAATTRPATATVLALLMVSVLQADCTPSHGTSEFAREVTAECQRGDVGTLKCSDDCSTLGLCVAYHKWQEVEKCGAGSICADGECKAKVNGVVCPGPDHAECVDGGVYPSLTSCTHYYKCVVQGASARVAHADYRSCPEGLQYNECSGKCDIYYGGKCVNTYSRCSKGSTHEAKGNPSLYYSCLQDGTPLWQRCEKGNYNPSSKKCTEDNNWCDPKDGEDGGDGGGGGETTTRGNWDGEETTTEWSDGEFTTEWKGH